MPVQQNQQKPERPKVILPKEKINATRKSPKTLIIYSVPKMGKSNIVAGLESCLLIDLEDASDCIDAVKVKVDSIKELNDLGFQLIEEKKPYKYIAIDTVTKLELWCEEIATQMYKRSTIGKNFHGSSVLELPNGAGYYWLRRSFSKAIDFIHTWADRVILLGHLRDKMLEKDGKEISAGDLDLTGKIRSITCARADAIGYLYRKTEDTRNGKPITPRYLSFNAKSETLSASRFAHLKGEVRISEKFSGNELVPDDEEGEIRTFWESIYPD